MKWYDLKELEKHHINHFAQAGEDGLLEYIFKNIEPRTKFAVEFGAGNMVHKRYDDIFKSALKKWKISHTRELDDKIDPGGTSEKTRFLQYINHDLKRGTPNVKWLVDEFGWTSIMWDYQKKKADNEKKNNKYGISQELVTYENVNDLFEKYKIPSDVDLVVIDVDGQDYWIWESLKWKPQVVEIEFNTALDVFKSKVMNKDSGHYKTRNSKSANYGASLSALKKLGTKKGYTMICRCGRNLFFVLNELVEDGYDVDIGDLNIEPFPSDSDREINKNNDKWIEV
jgi:hypothetical protein